MRDFGPGGSSCNNHHPFDLINGRPFNMQYNPHYQPLPVYRNGFGTASLVLGILGLLSSFIPFVGVIAWPLVILGIIFGWIGLRRAKRGEADNRGVALVGLIASVVGLVMCFVWLFVTAGAVANSEPTPAITGGAIPTVPAALPAGTFGDGMYEVPAEMPAGTYKTEGPTEQFGTKLPCYWAKHKDASGEFSSLITNQIVQGQATLTVNGGGGFVELTGGCTWVKQ